jgi:hypothetical protein
MLRLTFRCDTGSALLDLMFSPTAEVRFPVGLFVRHTDYSIRSTVKIIQTNPSVSNKFCVKMIQVKSPTVATFFSLIVGVSLTFN